MLAVLNLVSGVPGRCVSVNNYDDAIELGTKWVKEQEPEAEEEKIRVSLDTDGGWENAYYPSDMGFAVAIIEIE